MGRRLLDGIIHGLILMVVTTAAIGIIVVAAGKAVFDANYQNGANSQKWPENAATLTGQKENPAIQKGGFR